MWDAPHRCLYLLGLQLLELFGDVVEPLVLTVFILELGYCRYALEKTLITASAQGAFRLTNM